MKLFYNPPSPYAREVKVSHRSSMRATKVWKRNPSGTTSVHTLRR